jgi:hypothetical protein
MLSTVVSAPVNIVCSLLLVFAMLSCSGPAAEQALAASPPQRVLGAAIFTLAPRLDLLDLKQRATFDWGPISPAMVLTLSGYAAVYTAALLAGGCLLFRRKAL